MWHHVASWGQFRKQLTSWVVWFGLISTSCCMASETSLDGRPDLGLSLRSSSPAWNLLNLIVDCCLTFAERSSNLSSCGNFNLEVVQHHGSKVTWANAVRSTHFVIGAVGWKHFRGKYSSYRTAFSTSLSAWEQKTKHYWVLACISQTLLVF